MEIMIELTDAELDAVSGGQGMASIRLSNAASGPFATVMATLNIATTATSASLSGSFSSESDTV